jgi:ribosome-associated translation inhibitor RaiA
MLAAKEDRVSKQIRIRFCESLPDEGLLALAHHRLEELPEPWRRDAQCSVIVRRHKPSGARAVHHVQIDFERGPTRSPIHAASSDADPYAALSRAFDSARDSMMTAQTG